MTDIPEHILERVEAGEQARLLGMSGSKEARLQAQLAEARELLGLIDTCDIDQCWATDAWHFRRDALLKGSGR